MNSSELHAQVIHKKQQHESAKHHRLRNSKSLPHDTHQRKYGRQYKHDKYGLARRVAGALQYVMQMFTVC